MHKNNGFTILEVLIAIGVVAVVSAVAAPSFLTWRSNSQLRGAAEQLRGDLQLAKSRAVRETHTVIIKLRPDNYRIFVDAGNGSGGPPNGTYDHQETVVCERQLPAGIQLKYSTAGSMNGPPDGVPADDTDDTDNLESPPGARAGGVGGGLLDAPTGAGDASQGDVSPPGRTSPGDDDDDGEDDDDDADDDADSVTVVQQPAVRLSFDRMGRCLNPQNLVLENSRGKKRLIAVNPLGNVKVIKID